MAAVISPAHDALLISRGHVKGWEHALLVLTLLWTAAVSAVVDCSSQRCCGLQQSALLWTAAVSAVVDCSATLQEWITSSYKGRAS
jgi:hypothetical protein